MVNTFTLKRQKEVSELNRNKRKSEKGFTMIELILVIAILGIISAMLVPSFIEMSKKAKLTTDVSTAKTLQRTIDVYNVQPGVTVIDTANLESVVTKLKQEKLLSTDISLQTKGTLKVTGGLVKLDLSDADTDIKTMASELPVDDSLRAWITGVTYKE